MSVFLPFAGGFGWLHRAATVLTIRPLGRNAIGYGSFFESKEKPAIERVFIGAEMGNRTGA